MCKDRRARARVGGGAWAEWCSRAVCEKAVCEGGCRKLAVWAVTSPRSPNCFPPEAWPETTTNYFCDDCLAQIKQHAAEEPEYTPKLIERATETQLASLAARDAQADADSALLVMHMEARLQEQNWCDGCQTAFAKPDTTDTYLHYWPAPDLVLCGACSDKWLDGDEALHSRYPTTNFSVGRLR